MSRNTSKFVILACCLALASCRGRAQQPAASQLLQRAYDHWAKVQSAQATIKCEVDMGTMKSTMSLELAYRRPDGISLNMRGPKPVILVRNGDTRWIYIGGLGQYVKQPVKAGEPDFGDAENILPLTLGARVKMLDLLEGKPLSDSLVRARLLPEATVDEHPCEVVALPDRMPFFSSPTMKAESRLYLDKNDLTLRLAETTMILPPEAGPMRGGRLTMRQRYQDVKVDASIPEETFAFKPPQGANLVAEFGTAPQTQSPMAGKRAPDFSVKMISGQPVRLSYYKGKVLLLHFWASWCVPCQIEMPDLQIVYEQAKAKGVAFLGISLDTKAADAREFLQQERLALPSALDEKGFEGIAKRYKVKGIPSTFVIDRSGLVTAGFTGVTRPDRLVAALRRAGITAQLPSGPTPSEARRWQTLAHRDRAAKAFLLGRDEEAAKELRSLTELQPGSEDAWLLLAEFLLKTSQPAGDAINSALRAGKYSPALHARAARLCLENSAEPKTALEQARAAVRKSPDSPEYLALVGWACLQNDMLDEAKQNLEKALRLNARYAHARYLMGQVFEKEGKQDDALRDYRVALNLDPSLQEAKEAIDRLTAGGR